LGWADFRVTSYAQIERWWEMVMSAYLLVSSTQILLHQPNPNHQQRDAQPQTIVFKLTQHPDWNPAEGWKQALNNLRLVIQPSVILNLQPWLNLFQFRDYQRVSLFNCVDESLR